jgi:hypothetical protein
MLTELIHVYKKKTEKKQLHLHVEAPVYRLPVGLPRPYGINKKLYNIFRRAVIDMILCYYVSVVDDRLEFDPECSKSIIWDQPIWHDFNAMTHVSINKLNATASSIATRIQLIDIICCDIVLIQNRHCYGIDYGMKAFVNFF